MAEKVKYVEVPEYSIITSGLVKSSEDLKANIDSASEASTLHMNKHEDVKKALALVDAISKDIAKFVRNVPIKQPDKKPRAEQTTQAKLKAYVHEEDKDMIARSRRALANLQKNMAELKSELGRVR